MSLYGGFIWNIAYAHLQIGLAAACVSMLTLESTMLNTFNDGTMTDEARQILLGVSGAVLSVFVMSTAIYMINQSTKRLKNYK